MPQTCPAEPVVAVTRLPGSDKDVFVNTHPFETPGEKARSVFGGYLLGQCVAAAQQTVPETHDVHSLQSTFLRPGNPYEKVAYHVERLSDGRSFSTRQVRAVQGGHVVHFTAIVGFQKRSPAPSSLANDGDDARPSPPPPPPKLKYGEAMPQFGYGNPDDVDEGSAEACLVEGGYPKDMLDLWRDPFQWRILPRDRKKMMGGISGDSEEEKKGKEKKEEPTETAITYKNNNNNSPTHFRMQSFVRVHPAAQLDPAAPRATHLALLAFLSDLFLIYTTNLASARPVTGFAIETTMNHNVWFHNHDDDDDESSGSGSGSGGGGGGGGGALRADEWLACERDTSWADDGRVLIRQRLWRRRDGRLVMSCVQEALARLKQPGSSSL